MKRGDVDGEAGFEGGGLGGSGGGVAFDAGVGLGDLEWDGGGEFDGDGVFADDQDLGFGVFGQVVDGVADDIEGERLLLVGIGVHEVEQVAVAVEVLHGPVLGADAAELGAGLEGALDGVSAANVAQFESGLGRATSDLDVFPVDDLVLVAVEFDDESALEVAGGDHLLPVSCVRMCSAVDGVVPQVR